MAITARELMQKPKFEGIGKFVEARKANGEYPASFVFEFFGGQVSIEVNELEYSEYSKQPSTGSYYMLSGFVKFNVRNGSISLVAVERRKIADDESGLSDDHISTYVGGISIRGVARVKDKKATQIDNANTYISAVLEWPGATYQFKGYSRDVHESIPSPELDPEKPAMHVRCVFGILTREERSKTGQKFLQQVLTLASVAAEPLASSGAAGSASAAQAAPPGGATRPPVTPPK